MEPTSSSLNLAILRQDEFKTASTEQPKESLHRSRAREHTSSSSRKGANALRQELAKLLELREWCQTVSKNAAEDVHMIMAVNLADHELSGKHLRTFIEIDRTPSENLH